MRGQGGTLSRNDTWAGGAVCLGAVIATARSWGTQAASSGKLAIRVLLCSCAHARQTRRLVLGRYGAVANPCVGKGRRSLVPWPSLIRSSVSELRCCARAVARPRPLGVPQQRHIRTGRCLSERDVASSMSLAPLLAARDAARPGLAESDVVVDTRNRQVGGGARDRRQHAAGARRLSVHNGLQLGVSQHRVSTPVPAAHGTRCCRCICPNTDNRFTQRAVTTHIFTNTITMQAN